jgi:hypothetical protein
MCLGSGCDFISSVVVVVFAVVVVVVVVVVVGWVVDLSSGFSGDPFLSLSPLRLLVARPLLNWPLLAPLALTVLCGKSARTGRTGTSSWWVG